MENQNKKKETEKVLIVASVASMIDQFNKENIKILQKMGYAVEVACNFEEGSTMSEEKINDLKNYLSEKNVKFYHIPVPRSLAKFNDIIKSRKNLKEIMESNKYKIIHCHSPIGGVITRSAAKKTRKKGTKVIYTAHGFHFYKGAPVKNWLLYYPIEKYYARFTDVLLTINSEDFSTAKHINSKMKVYKIPGVGIDYEKCQVPFSYDKSKIIKEKLGIPEDAKVIISVGEINKNKNHMTAIEAISAIDKNIYYIICGIGEEKENLERIAEELNIRDKIIFLGYVTDKRPYYLIADMGVFLSRREGLGLAGLEIMAAGLPLISSYIGGIKDYTINEKTGYTVSNPLDVKSVAKSINSILDLKDEKLREIEEFNRSMARKFDKEIVNEKMHNIYLEIEK